MELIRQPVICLFELFLNLHLDYGHTWDSFQVPHLIPLASIIFLFPHVCVCDVHANIIHIHMFVSVCMYVETRGVPSVFLGHSPLYLRRRDLLMKMEN